VTTENQDTGAVRVSMKDIYFQVQKIQSMLEKLSAQLPDSEEKIDDHEKRIRALERRIWQVVGGMGLIVAAAPFLVRLMP